MRQKAEELLPLCHIFPDHQMARELGKISEILDQNPRISEIVLQDLCDNSNPQKGASGLSADFVLRAAIVKQMHGFSYERLAFHLLDSQSFRTFVRHPLGWIPNKSTLQRNISKLSAAGWKAINGVLAEWAAEKGLEKGQRIRLDSTAVESDIHHPTDSSLLYDAVRTVSGPSSLITSCAVLPGNPADVGQFQPLLEAHRDVYGRYPRQIAADRGFYSQANLSWAKGEGIVDAAFDRKGTLAIDDMVSSSWIYKQLRRFRAGIEGCISWAKRVFGLDRCTWKGWEHFRQYVQASVVSYNLLVLARLLL